MAFRVGGEFFTESFLRGIIGSLSDDSIGRILEFTTVLDERKKLPAYGFLVELDGELGIFHVSAAPYRLTHFIPQDETPLGPSLSSKKSCRPTLPTRTIATTPMPVILRYESSNLERSKNIDNGKVIAVALALVRLRFRQCLQILSLLTGWRRGWSLRFKANVLL